MSLGFPGLVKNLPGDPSSISGSKRCSGEGIGYPLQYSWASLVAQRVKNPPAMWERFWALGLIPGLGRSPGEVIGYPFQYSWASLVTQLVKNPPAMRKTWVGTLGWKDPLEKGTATHSSILAWVAVRQDWVTFTFTWHFTTFLMAPMSILSPCLLILVANTHPLFLFPFFFLLLFIYLF